MGCSGATRSGSKSWWSASYHRHARGGECYLLRPAWRLPMASAAEGLSTLSDGLRLLSKLAVVGDMGTAKGSNGRPAPSQLRGALLARRIPFTRTPAESIVTRSPATPAKRLIKAPQPAAL